MDSGACYTAVAITYDMYNVLCPIMTGNGEVSIKRVEGGSSTLGMQHIPSACHPKGGKFDGFRLSEPVRVYEWYAYRMRLPGTEIISILGWLVRLLATFVTELIPDAHHVAMFLS